MTGFSLSNHLARSDRPGEGAFLYTDIENYSVEL